MGITSKPVTDLRSIWRNVSRLDSHRHRFRRQPRSQSQVIRHGNPKQRQEQSHAACLIRNS
jgi:hypothetical protein